MMDTFRRWLRNMLWLVYILLDAPVERVGGGGWGGSLGGSSRGRMDSFSGVSPLHYRGVRRPPRRTACRAPTQTSAAAPRALQLAAAQRTLRPARSMTASHCCTRVRVGREALEAAPHLLIAPPALRDCPPTAPHLLIAPPALRDSPPTGSWRRERLRRWRSPHRQQTRRRAAAARRAPPPTNQEVRVMGCEWWCG